MIDLILILISIVSFLLSFVSELTFAFFLNIGLFSSLIWGTILIYRNITLTNFSFFSIGIGSNIFFTLGGFWYAIQSSSLDKVISYLRSTGGYVFELTDIAWACLYVYFFAIIFLIIDRNLSVKNPIDYYGFFKKLNSDLFEDSKIKLYIWFALIVEGLKLYLLVSGKANFSFLFDPDAKIVTGDSSSIIPLLMLDFSPSGTFLIFLLFLYKKISNRLFIICLIPDIIYLLTIGRRPIIYHFLLIVIAFSIKIKFSNTDKILHPFETTINPQNSRKQIFVICGLILACLAIVQLLTIFRFFTLAQDQVSMSMSPIELVQDFLLNGKIFSSLSTGDISDQVQDNFSIRNSFSLGYLTHTISGFIKAKQFVYGAILLSSILYIIPSNLGLYDKSEMANHGQTLIADIIKNGYGDAAKSIATYSFADFFLLGPVIYGLVLYIVSYYFFEFVKRDYSSKNSLMYCVCFSCMTNFYIQMPEAEMAVFFLLIRNSLIVMFLHGIVSGLKK